MTRIRAAAITRRRDMWRTARLVLAVGITAIVGVSACGPAPSTPSQLGAIVEKGTPYSDLLVPSLKMSVSEGAVGVSVESPVTVSAASGVLGPVALINDRGRVVNGELSSDGVTWRSTEPLGYNRTYTLNAEALGLSGVAQKTATFQTHSPQNLTMPYVSPNDGSVVGVGQPIAVRFDENISDRLAAQRSISITTNPPIDGAFYWLNDREVRWRPAQYWKPGTTVSVQVKAYGADFGGGLFGQDDVSTRFTIGDEVIATADDATKTMTVRVNGSVVKTMPISMGKNKTPTDNGTYIIGDRYPTLVMDSSTYGVPVNSPDGYRTEVNWATQMSYSGIYVHSAPWSVGSQGRNNVSHGCLNVSPENAKWFYDTTKRGDVVEVINTVGPTLPGTDGLGDWNVPWDQWSAGNAAL
ncbi:Ig-like domain-containing protein (plasmid) [Mycolicibacterium crocinum]|uniref:Ig-like domain-containing protein n=2 Tax=Mycolicibacterium crocinum TaxID=388459 RepID=A0ABY3U0V8_9MYCO|nr:Ig-like domain-containing protein [Mycolicibacterium crocinum]